MGVTRATEDGKMDGRRRAGRETILLFAPPRTSGRTFVKIADGETPEVKLSNDDRLRYPRHRLRESVGKKGKRKGREKGDNE